MPIYEYKCRNCQSEFEFFVRSASKQEKPACAECGSHDLEKKFSIPAGLSSAVSRESGQTCCGRDSRCDTPPCTQGDSCRRG